MKKALLTRAFRDTVPVLTGYLVIGMGFGMVMTANGYGLWWALAMSLFIYAGSMQYVGIGLLTGGASLLTVALTTLAVNARHLFYGISMVDAYKDTGARKPYMIFALTDETYSLVCSGQKPKEYMFLVSLLDHLYWMAGTLIGSLLGRALPFSTEGIDFALTALFITVFVEQWLSGEGHIPALLGLGGSCLCLLVFGADNFLIPSMLLLTAVLLLRMRKEAQHVD